MRKLILVLGIIFLCCAPSWAGMNKTDVLSTFVKGNMAYKDTRYQEAVQSYLEILNNGWENGAIYYNLANSYFKAGDMGRALLNYKRAKRFLPRDADLRANVNYTRSLSQTEPPARKTLVVKMVEGHLNFYTMNEMALILLMLVAGAVVVHLLFLYLNGPVKFMRGMLAVLFLLMGVFTAGLVIKARASDGLYMIVRQTPARFEPRAGGSVYFELYQGAEVKVFRKEDGWAKIQRMDGKEGWIPAEMMEKI